MYGVYQQINISKKLLDDILHARHYLSYTAAQSVGITRNKYAGARYRDVVVGAGDGGG